jgi:hypothetical protein
MKQELSQRNMDINEQQQYVHDMMQCIFHDFLSGDYPSLLATLKNFCSGRFVLRSETLFGVPRETDLFGLFIVLVVLNEVYPDLSWAMLDSRVASNQESPPPTRFSVEPSWSLPDQYFEFVIKFSGVKLAFCSLSELLSRAVMEFQFYNQLMMQSEKEIVEIIHKIFMERNFQIFNNSSHGHNIRSQQISTISSAQLSRNPRFHELFRFNNELISSRNPFQSSSSYSSSTVPDYASSSWVSMYESQTFILELSVVLDPFNNIDYWKIEVLASSSTAVRID